MASESGKSSKLACVGFFFGAVLLVFAGTLVAENSSARPQPAIKEVHSSARFLQAVTTTPSASSGSFDSSGSGSSSDSFRSSGRGSSGSLKSSGAGLEWIWATLCSYLGVGGFQLAIMLCFACCYYEKVVVPIVGEDGQGTLDRRKPGAWRGKDDFDNNICGCTEDMWVCIHGFFCPLVRMAHTNAVSGVCGYWESAACFFCCAVWSAGFGPCCLMVWWRMQLKKIMGIEDHICNDFCVTLFCPLLSVCQQGIAVDEAMGYEVVGCCDLEWNSPMAKVDDQIGLTYDPRM